MGGLICSTALTLLIVPLFYTYLDDLRVYLGRLAVGAMRRTASPHAAAADLAERHS